MKLGIISDCTHYRTADGRVGTENHVLLRQFEALAIHFDETLICCPFANNSSSKTLSFYTSGKINFTPVPVAGGNTLKDKTMLLATLPAWLKRFNQLNTFADIVYQRFPNNLNIPGFFYFRFKQKMVFATYTGTWKNYDGEPMTFRFQKWLLSRFLRGPVWVYHENRSADPRIIAGYSPSYSKAEWSEECDQVAARITRLKRGGLKVYRLISVGTLIDYKNQLTILRACVILKSKKFPFKIKIIGDGPMFKTLRDFIAENDLADVAELCGKKDQVALRAMYGDADFVVQAPLAEGFGKVPVEGFFHGVIPIISNISLARQITDEGKRGFLFDGKSVESLVKTIETLPVILEQLPLMIEKGRSFAKTQTLETWAQEYYNTATTYFENA